MSLSLIICEDPANRGTFRLALLELRIKPLHDIQADILGDAIKIGKQVLESQPELTDSAWDGGIDIGYARVVNPDKLPERWAIDFSPIVPDEVNAILLSTVGKADGF